MGLLKKGKKKTKLKSLRSAGGSSVETSPFRPKQIQKAPPCGLSCPNHTEIRKFIMAVGLAEKKEKSYDEAFTEAWEIITNKNPMPSVIGRVCPHPCESGCNRNEKEGPVGINNLERYVGDFGIKKGLKLKKVTDETHPEKIAVIGAGPAGLSCAYQMARRGYKVTIFEANKKTGGMLRYGIPSYRLPDDILDAEVNRILDLGVELKIETKIGTDIPYADLEKDYDAIFVGIGAHMGTNLRVEGEEAPNVLTGVEFLKTINSGETVDVGEEVVVIGGGDTAIDAARISRRLGAKATILYRRTRKEMPAIDEEIVGAEEEGVNIEYLAAPIGIEKNGDGKATGMKCIRMELGEPDSSGRRRPVPIEGSEYIRSASTVITAISQYPDFTGFEDLRASEKDWLKVDENYAMAKEKTYAGGDAKDLGLVVDALFHGRIAAQSLHDKLRGLDPEVKEKLPEIPHDKMRLEFYEEKNKLVPAQIEMEERLGKLNAEIVFTLSDDNAVIEASRCMSCGMCFDCDTCWSYCQDNAIIKPIERGVPYSFKMEFCNGCKKCAENCPCGYLEMH